MPRQSDIDYKSFITAIGKLIDAKNKTQAVIIRAEVKADTEAIVKASEERVKKELRAELASKEDIKDMATKQDIAQLKQEVVRLEGKIDETKDLRNRLGDVEEELMSIRSKN